MDTLYRFITPLLGLIFGILVAAPAAVAGGGMLAWVAFPLMGALVGYRKRHSRAFFYVTLICVTLMASVVGTSLIQR